MRKCVKKVEQNQKSKYLDIQIKLSKYYLTLF